MTLVLIVLRALRYQGRGRCVDVNATNNMRHRATRGSVCSAACCRSLPIITLAACTATG